MSHRSVNHQLQHRHHNQNEFELVYCMAGGMTGGDRTIQSSPVYEIHHDKVRAVTQMVVAVVVAAAVVSKCRISCHRRSWSRKDTFRSLPLP